MYKFITSSDDVIALRLTNTITGDDLNAIMDRVDDMMAKQEKIHVFVETQAIEWPAPFCLAPPSELGLGVRYYPRSATGCLKPTGATRHSLGSSEVRNAVRYAAIQMSDFLP